MKMTSPIANTIEKSLWVMICIGAFMLCLSSVSAWNTNVFSNSLTNENFSMLNETINETDHPVLINARLPPWEYCTNMTLNENGLIEIDFDVYNYTKIYPYATIRIRDIGGNILEEMNDTNRDGIVNSVSRYLRNVEYGICLRHYNTTATSSQFKYNNNFKGYVVTGSDVANFPYFRIASKENVTRYLSIPSTVSALTKGYLNLSAFYINFSLAMNITNTTATTFARDDYVGQTFTADGSFYIHNIRYFASIEEDYGTGCWIYNGTNQSVLVNGTQSFSAGDGNAVCTFDKPLKVENGTSYFFLINSSIVSVFHTLSGNSTGNQYPGGINYGCRGIPTNCTLKFDENSDYAIRIYKADYPENVSLSVGNTNIFNYIGYFGETNNRTSNLASIINKYFTSTYLVGSNYLIPFSFHSDTIGILQYLDLLFNNDGFLENSQTYNPTANSGVKEYFLINITFDSAYYSAISTELVYNNTNYPSSQINTGNNVIFNATVTTPLVSTSTAKTFYWIIHLTNSSGINDFNSTSKTQTISQLQVDNCTLYNSNILNFSLFDEDSRDQLNGTIELDITFYSSGTIVTYYNNSYNFAQGHPARVCMNQTNSSLTMDYHAKYYSNTSYVVENKFAQKLSVTNVTQVVSLYDLLSSRSTAFTITLQSATLDLISGALIDIQREYVPINQFISVETPLTDSDGATIGHFVAEDVYYTFIVTKNGELLGTFNKQSVKCQDAITGDCRIVLNLIQASAGIPDFEHYGNISVNYLWQPTTRTLITTWLSSDSSTHTVGQNVSLFDNFGNNTICQNSVTGISGSFTCVVPVGYGNTTIVSSMYSDGIFLGYAYFNLGDTAQNIFGGTKVILGMLMYTTLTFLMISNPIAIVIGAILGMVFAMAFHIVDGGSFFGNTSIVLWFIIAGGIIIYKANSKNY